MSLSDFLAGSLARPNPKAAYRIEHRHAEGGAWTVVARAGTAARIADERKVGALDWPVGASPGDLARVCGGHRDVWYGVGRGGALHLLPANPWATPAGSAAAARASAWGGLDRPWVMAWETCPDARWMLEALTVRVNHRTFIHAAAAVAAAALDRAPAEFADSLVRSRAVLDTVRRWAAGAATGHELAAAPAEANADEYALRARGYEAEDEGDEERGDEFFSAGAAAGAAKALAELAQPGQTDVVSTNYLRALIEEATFEHPPHLAAAADAVRRALPTADLVLALIAGPRGRGPALPGA